jgi:uncharacterized protein YndB with AHSA1/START domain
VTDSPTSGATLMLERRIAAPLPLVYSLLVDPDELRCWLGPRGFDCTLFEADVRVGGSFRFRMRKHGGGDYGAGGEFREIIHNERVVLTWRWNEAPPGEPLDRSETLVTMAVRADGDATVLTLTHAQLPDQTSADTHGSGWNDGLDKLITRIEQLKGTRP